MTVTLASSSGRVVVLVYFVAIVVVAHIIAYAILLALPRKAAPVPRIKRPSKRDLAAAAEADRVLQHRRECAALMRWLRANVAPGQVYDLPTGRLFYRMSCACRYLDWPITGRSTDERVYVTRPL